MTRRTTRTYGRFTHWPRWVSYSQYDKPINWHLFRWWDFLPLAVAMVAAAVIWPHGGAPEWTGTVLAVWVLTLPVFMVIRLRRRARWCAEHEHMPYRPVPEDDEWECLYCGSPLEVDDPNVVATSVARAASDVELGRRAKRSQAHWSDRR